MKPKHTSARWYRAGNMILAGSLPAKEICRICDDRESGDEPEANACLIAAAPELLAACESMLAWMEFTIPRLKGKCPHCGDDVDAGGLNWGGPIHKARTAIAKAAGQNFSSDSSPKSRSTLARTARAAQGKIPAIVRTLGQGAAVKFAEKSGALDVALDRMIDEVEGEAR